MIKQTLIAGAALLLAAAPAAFAYHSGPSHSFNGNTVVVNNSELSNTVTSTTSTGGNVTTVGGDIVTVAKSHTYKAEGGDTTAGGANGNGAAVTTGSATSTTGVVNVVNSTVLEQ